MTKRLFVLDTNVLMHDPTALFRFKEHDIFLPMVVLEELDAAKKGLSEVSRNVRQASRFMDQLMQGRTHEEIAGGLAIDGGQTVDLQGTARPSGRLFFQITPARGDLPDYLPGSKADNSILHTALSLQQEELADRELTLVSKDINLRIKAAVLGIHAEDYENDKVLEDSDLLTPGFTSLEAGFWEQQGPEMTSWQDGGRSFYRLRGDAAADWHANQFLYFSDGGGPDLVVRAQEEDGTVVEVVRDFASGRHPVWGVNARNREQNFALNLLMDPEVDFVTLLGPAGTGKTLLTLAAGLAQTLDEQRYREIIMTRNTVPLGDDIGFLPGSEEEKMTPWMGALMDNLEVLTHDGDSGDWERAATQELLSKRIKVRSMNFMRGRTFVNRYLILDEAQNLTAKQMKTLITRAGPGTKIVCLGNLAQIDTPYLTETTSGLTFVVDRFRTWAHAGHVTLARGERSRLADFASRTL